MNIWPVFLREMMLFTNRIRKPGYVVATIMTPLLYLITFGLGLGRRFSIEGTSYLQFIIPGICAMSSMINAFGGIATSIAVGRLHFKSIEEILISPVSYRAIALGEIGGGTVRGLFSSIFILIAALLMGVPFPSSPCFYFAWFLTAIFFASLGVIAGFIARSHDDTATFSNFIIMPMSFLCGTFFPVHNLPTVIAWLLQLFPLTHSVVCMRAGFQHQPVSPFHLAVLVVFCIAGFAGAEAAIRKSLR